MQQTTPSRSRSRWSLRFTDARIEAAFKQTREARLAMKMRHVFIITAMNSIGTIFMQRQWRGAAGYENDEQARIGRVRFVINIFFTVVLVGLIVVTKSERAVKKLGTLGLEVTTIIAACFAMLSLVFVMREFAARMLGHDPVVVYEGGLPSTELLFLLYTHIIVSATHVLLPSRWCSMLPLQIFVCLVYTTATICFSRARETLPVNILGFITLLFLASYGKRSSEIQERDNFTSVIDEKQKRCEAEFSLETFQQQSSKGPASVASTGEIFNNFASEADRDEAIEKLMALGQKEKWTVESKSLVMDSGPMLGAGGFGCVLPGTLHGTPVVVKVPRDLINPSKLQALGNELRLLRHLRHQSIVLFHGACVIEGEHQHFGLVLERVDGHELTQAVTLLSRRHALQVSVAICRAVRYLHSQEPPIIHGDLKPGNVLVDLVAHKALTKVIDFGLSRRMGVGSLGGSRKWLSPEQLLDPRMPPSASVDVFAFGSIVYYMQAQSPPMLGLNQQDFAGSALDRPPRPVAILDFLTDAARAPAMDCLIFDPKRRPGELSAVQAALERCEGRALRTTEDDTEAQNKLPPVPTSDSGWTQALEELTRTRVGTGTDEQQTPQDISGCCSSGVTENNMKPVISQSDLVRV